VSGSPNGRAGVLIIVFSILFFHHGAGRGRYCRLPCARNPSEIASEALKPERLTKGGLGQKNVATGIPERLEGILVVLVQAAGALPGSRRMSKLIATGILRVKNQHPDTALNQCRCVVYLQPSNLRHASLFPPRSKPDNFLDSTWLLFPMSRSDSVWSENGRR
jgi:hypothetical protein